MTRSILHIRYTIAVAIFFAILAAVSAPAAMAQESGNRTVEVIGTGRIVQGDISSARDTAISDALVTAVGLVTSDLLHQLVIVESFENVNSLLLSDAGSFVQYKILAETTSGKIYRVMVETEVSVDKISEILTQNGILVRSEAPLKVLLLIAENQLDGTVCQSWWTDPFVESIAESGLADALGSQGLDVVDHGQFLPATIEAYISESETMHDWEISDTQAAFFGSWYEADVVVVGTASAERAPNAMGDELRSFKGTLSVRALRTDTGELLAESTRSVLTTDTDDVAGNDNALSEAGTRVGALLVGQIQNAWNQSEETGPLAVTVVVKGGYQLAHFVAFRRTLSELPGVGSLQTSGMTPEETILNLEYEGTTQEMVEALLLKSFNGFGVHIDEPTADTLRLALVPN